MFLKPFAGAMLAALLLVFATQAATTRIDIVGPVGTYSFGGIITPLPNGNIVIIDTDYRPPSGQFSSGGVFLYSGASGQLISSLYGTKSGDRVGSSGITILPNGDYLVKSPYWDNGTAADAGAVTYCSGTTGCSGAVSAANSLVGTQTNDVVGGQGVVSLNNGSYVVLSSLWSNGSISAAGAVTFCKGPVNCLGAISLSNTLIGTHTQDFQGRDIKYQATITVLPNNNYIVNNATWYGYRGATTLCSGTTGCQGEVSGANSLVGSSANDYVGYESTTDKGLKVLANGNYVVDSPFWDNGTQENAGAVTFCSGVAGCQGTISSLNSLVGSAGDFVDFAGAIPLANGNYVVVSTSWNNSRGAITWGSGTSGVTGTISAVNSLIGNLPNDQIGSAGIVALSNGNYVVKSPTWKGTYGAVTWGSGTGGTAGIVSSLNSLVGTYPNDRVGAVTALANGNYVVACSTWNSSRGAATLANGDTGLTGEISAANSLVGNAAGDAIGMQATALTNGNYVVTSAAWSNGGVAAVGAATFCQGTNGCTGFVSPGNSLIGSHTNDRVGAVKALTNGNYVVYSPRWNGDRGAVTFCSGTTGRVDVVSSAISLTGSNASDMVGEEQITALANGDYVVNSYNWNSQRGAVTRGSGTGGVSGEVSAANSLVGNQSGDLVGFDGFNQNRGGGIYPLKDGGFIVRSAYWSKPPNGYREGAVTLSSPRQPFAGTITNDNSITGFYNQTGSQLVFAYDEVNRQLIANVPLKYTCTLLRYVNPKTAFDFDNDSRADLSIFRPATATWYFQGSTSGFAAIPWGAGNDKPVPADYDGDGKVDVAVYRAGYWYILKSSNQQVIDLGFGTTEDLPVPGDYDGDGKADVTVYRLSNSTFYRINSSDGAFSANSWGAVGDLPVMGDFDGDGKTDLCVYRPTTGAWYRLNSSNNQFVADSFGAPGDLLVPADYDGDGKTDIAVYRPSNSVWYRVNSANGSFAAAGWGAGTDKPVPADYDGDGKADIAVYRDGLWFIVRSTDGQVGYGSFGGADDIPLAYAYVK